MTTPFYISISNIQRFLFLTSLLAPVVIVLVIVIMLLLSCFSCAQLFTTPWTAAHQAPPSIGFSRQEYWSGVPLPSPVQPSIQPLFNVPFFCHWFMVPGGPWAREYYYSVESGWVSCHIELCGPGYLPFPRGRLRVNTEINWLISVMVACVYVSSPFLMSDLEISMLG